MDKFKELITEEHEFPCRFKFKFIVKKEYVDEVLKYFTDCVPELRYSSNEKYCSVTVSPEVADADEVVKIYTSLSKIKGIISL